MHPDDEPALKAAFAELRQRRREQAPSFEPMRERALRNADESAASRPAGRVIAPRLAWAAAVCAIALGTWWAFETSRTDGQTTQPAVATEQVENLIAAIEQQLEANSAGLDYPTDLLLVENQADLPQ